jgi:hypothetical protein
MGKATRLATYEVLVQGHPGSLLDQEDREIQAEEQTQLQAISVSDLS